MELHGYCLAPPCKTFELHNAIAEETAVHACRAVQDIGGNDIQKQEIKEAVELPLTHHELYRQIGIDPPRGVLLYGAPGTGKTMLAKAVAHHTTAAFIRVVGSEFVQKYLGEVASHSLHLRKAGVAAVAQCMSVCDAITAPLCVPDMPGC